MKEIELIPDAANLIESTRAIGYSFETAIADIIDNSVSNKATEIYVDFFSGSGENNKAYVAIIDNGRGLSESELINAMKYGSQWTLNERDKEDLGRFGLGLKLASLSQCRKLTVISKKDNSINSAKWDLDYIFEKNEWKLFLNDELEISEEYFKKLEEFETGTIVLWENFDRIEASGGKFEKLFDTKLDNASFHVGLVFHRYIDSKKNKISIYFNEVEIDAVDPFYTKNTSTQLIEINDLKINSERIKINPYVIPYKSKRSQKEKQLDEKYSFLKLREGLYIYRNKRLIAYGKWFKLINSNELSSLVRIMIDLPNSMDQTWNLDVKKSSLEIPQMIKDDLKKIIFKISVKSEKVITNPREKRNRDTEKGVIHIFDRFEDKDGKVSYKINQDTYLIKALKNELTEQGEIYFKELIKHINFGIPYQSIYADMAEKNSYELTLNSFGNDDYVYNEIYNFLDLKSNKEEKLRMLDEIEKYEIYKNYTNIITKIKMELKGIK